MVSFRDSVLNNNTDIITEIMVSLGPAGELRYPAYPLSRWSFPGVGEFQCYDRYMLASLKQAATAVGHPEWGTGGPSNAGTYSDNANNVPFFQEGQFDNYASDYGKFFLNWYSSVLIQHGKMESR
jgi:beta-amylase